MSTDALRKRDAQRIRTRRSLLVIWQDPETRRFIRIGRLNLLVDDSYSFEYLHQDSGRGTPHILDEFPDIERIYVSNQLPSFFANRVMSSGRSTYPQYLNWLGIRSLESVEIPIEILARTGGGRATDTYHLVEEPAASNEVFDCRFFVSGVRYLPDGERTVAQLTDMASLSLRPEPFNQENPRAIVVAADGTQIGYVPDWLCGEVHSLISDGWSVNAVAEQVNPDAPAHVRVLCRIEARRD